MAYLSKVGCIDSLPNVAELAGSTQEDDPLADYAIEVLSDFEGAKGLETLLALARSPNQTVRANAIARSLAKTKAPAAIEALMKQGREGQVAALDALAEAQLPECFDYFAELASHPIEGVLENTILHGLAASDRKKAVPLLFSMLKQKSTATDQDPVEVSPLVQELIQLGADIPIDDLATLAHEGNQRALYILSNLDQEKAYPALREIAGSKASVETRRIALRGLQMHWAKQSAALFASALNDDDPETVSVAIQGLQAAGDTTQVPALLHMLNNEHATEVAQALEVLGPGANSGEYLKALLASEDVSVLSSLASGLIEHNWTDRQAIKPLISRLDSPEPTAQYQIIRLLRHVTQNAVGPEDYSDFEKEPATWVARWKEWAKKQGLGEIASNIAAVPSIPKIPDIPAVPPVPELPQTSLQAPAVSEQSPIDKPAAAQSETKADTTEISQLNKPVFENTTKEPVLLRYKLKQDQVMKLVMDANSEIQMEAGGQKMNMGQAIHIDAKARVTEVDEKGNISVLVKITRLKMKMDGMAKVEFDSDKPDENNPAFQAVTAMIGVGIPCKISPIGEMLETDLEPLRLAVRRVNNAALTKALEDSTSKMFEGTFVQLSKDPIAAGQTYKAGTLVSGGMKIQTSYKIDSVKGDRSQVIMAPVIAIEMAKDAMPNAEAKVVSQDASGWLLFDVEKGYSSEGQMRINMTLEISANGQKALMHTTTRVQSVSSLN
jgi:HEAT repeat protein